MTATIDDLAQGGDGVGRLEGKVLFVPLTAPGDVASVRIADDRGTFLRGRLEGLIRKSPSRTRPRCPLFGICGGCHWQHILYKEQLAAKGRFVVESLRRIGKVDVEGDVEVIPSILRYGYRHRCRLQVERRRGKTVLGYYRAGSHDLVPVESCPVLTPTLNSLLPLVHDTVRDNGESFRKLSDISLFSDFSGARARLVFNSRRGRLDLPETAARKVIGRAEKEGIELDFPPFREKGLPLGPEPTDLIASGECFTQVNLRQNRNLIGRLLTLAAPARQERVLDLFCGIGNFSIPLSAAGAEVIGVDLKNSTIRCARANAARLGVDALFQRGDAAEAAVSLAERGERFDLVIVNPPRAGCRDLARALPALKAARVAMVSCDPATFARDASLLIAGGYRLSDIKALDLFPQTCHVEIIGLFTLP